MTTTAPPDRPETTAVIARPRPDGYVGRYRHPDTITPDPADLGVIALGAAQILAGYIAGAFVYGWWR